MTSRDIDPNNIFYQKCLCKGNIATIIQIVGTKVVLRPKDYNKCVSLVTGIMKSSINKISKIPVSKQDMDIMLNHLNDKCVKHMVNVLLAKYPGLAKTSPEINKESWMPFESESGLCDIEEAMRQPEFINDVSLTETFLKNNNSLSGGKMLFTEPKSEKLSPKQSCPTPPPVTRKLINNNKRPIYFNPVDKDKLLLARTNNTSKILDDSSTKKLPKSDTFNSRPKSRAFRYLAKNKKLLTTSNQKIDNKTVPELVTETVI